MSGLFQKITRSQFGRNVFGFYNNQVSYLASAFYSEKLVTNPKFVIYGQGRTGSTLLVNLLNSHPKVFCEREIFMDKNNPPDGQVSHPRRLLRGKASLYRRKVYGYKVKIYQLSPIRSVESPKAFLTTSLEDGWKIIYLYRRNAFEHALSNLVAENLNQYHFSKKEGKSKFDDLKLTIPTALMIERIQGRIKLGEEERESLVGIPHIPVCYEDLATNSQEIAGDIFDFLKIDRFPVATRLQKTNTKKYSELISNFDEIYEAMKAHGFDQFIDLSRV